MKRNHEKNEEDSNENMTLSNQMTLAIRIENHQTSMLNRDSVELSDQLEYYRKSHMKISVEDQYG